MHVGAAQSGPYQDEVRFTEDVTGSDVVEQPLETPLPAYPEEAIRNQLQSLVRTEFVISEDGSVRDVRFAGCTPLFKNAVAEALQHWRYAPRRIQGQSVSATTKAQIRFSILNGQPKIDMHFADILPELLLRRPLVRYPVLARSARIQGPVVVDMTIGEDGEVASLQYIAGHPLLVPYAIDALRQWRFRPRLVYGSPVAITKRYVVNFEPCETEQIPLLASEIKGFLYDRQVLELRLGGGPQPLVWPVDKRERKK